MAKQFKIYKASDRIARLAKTRVRIVHDESPREPWEDMDMVFTQLDHERLSSIEDHFNNAIAEFKFDSNDGETHIWYTTPDRLLQYFSTNRADWTKERINKIIDEEREILKLWDNGEMFVMIREEWDDSERKWKRKWSMCQIYGAEDTLANLPEIAEDDDVICVDSDAEFYFELTKDETEIVRA